MTAHLISDENVVHTTEQSSGKVHTNSGHPVVGTLQEVVGTLAATEAGDTAAIAGLVGLIGTLAATEGADTAAFTGLASVHGALAAVEAADTASFAATVATLGSLAATEGADVFAATGIVASAGEIIGSLDAAEGADTAAFAGVVETGTAAIAVGGGFPLWRPPLVEGVGYGILPRIEGDAHGVVAGARIAIAPRVIGGARGSAGIAGRARLSIPAVKAAAAGDHGQIGAAVMVLELGAAGSGIAGARGKGSGTIANLAGTSCGRHDPAGDDEAAAILWMLAA